MGNHPDIYPRDQGCCPGAGGTAPQPGPAPLPISEMNHPDWMEVCEETGLVLRECSSPAGGKPSLSLPQRGQVGWCSCRTHRHCSSPGSSQTILDPAQGYGLVFVREPQPLLWEQLLMDVRERVVHRDRMQDHHHRMPWKITEEGTQQLRGVTVLEAFFGRDGPDNPDKVRCSGQVLWSLAHPGPSQYSTFMAMSPLNAEDT